MNEVIRKPNKLGYIFIFFCITLVILLGITSVYFYKKYRDAEKMLKNVPAANTISDQEVIKKAGLLMDLPQGETPQVATVLDVEKLKSQPFFAKAKNGDKVLVYNQAKKAILYDPVANKIVEVGPLLSAPTDTMPTGNDTKGPPMDTITPRISISPTVMQPRPTITKAKEILSTPTLPPIENP